jgi:phosphatidate cytidylyltransferase
MTHQDAPLAVSQAMLTVIGVLYVGFPGGFAIAIRALPDGLLWLTVVLAATWGADTCAYFAGVMFGKHKLAPRLSPKKTVEGAIGGLIGGFALALLVLVIGDQVNSTTLVMIALAPPVSIVGDLGESAIKRFFGVKDSHLPGLDLIPGHGGVLDRMDALLVVVTFCYLYLLATGITV